ncbi:MAG: PEP-CTERM sorting domain-containing protein, partial [Solirubrobacterales bacterium]
GYISGLNEERVCDVVIWSDDHEINTVGSIWWGDGGFQIHILDANLQQLPDGVPFEDPFAAVSVTLLSQRGIPTFSFDFVGLAYDHSPTLMTPFNVGLYTYAADGSVRSFDYLSVTPSADKPIPEPSSVLLAAAGAITVGFFIRKANQRRE